MSWSVCALYRFTRLEDRPALRASLQALCESQDVCGTLLLAPEGINGTIAGRPEGLGGVVDALDARLNIRAGEVKFSTAAEKPFNRMKVRLKKEIITMRAPEADPTERVGAYIAPADWNALISDPEVTVIDTRNDYETKLGTFEGAIDPNLSTFTDFKDFVARELDPAKHKKVAMFCTGGIRCEKASSYMLAHGFEQVFHLRGGILKYLEEIPAADSRWQGDCFVFDHRVSIGNGLTQTDWAVCFGCRAPLSVADRAHPAYEPGVCCPHCIDQLTPARERSLRERQRQFAARAVAPAPKSSAD